MSKLSNPIIGDWLAPKHIYQIIFAINVNRSQWHFKSNKYVRKYAQFIASFLFLLCCDVYRNRIRSVKSDSLADTENIFQYVSSINIQVLIQGGGHYQLPQTAKC